MSCKYCSGRKLVKAILKKEDQTFCGLINYDLIKLPKKYSVRLNGEEGWKIDTLYMAYAFWEKDIQNNVLDKILNVEPERPLKYKDIKRLIINAISNGCKNVPEIIEWFGIIAPRERTVRKIVWNLVDRGEVVFVMNRSLQLKKENNENQN